MANLANFKVLLAEEAAKNGLPNVVLSQNTDIGQAFDQLVTIDNRQDNESDAQVVSRYVDEICVALSKEENAKVVELFNSVSMTFSDKIKTAWATIVAINEQANALAEEMDSKTQIYLGKNEFVQTHQNYENMSEEFPQFSWMGTTVMGSPDDIIREVNLLASGGNDNPELPKSIDKRMLDIVVSNLDHHIKVNKFDGVTEDDRKNIVESAMQRYPDISAATVTDVVDIILGIRPFQNTYNSLKYINTEKPSELFKNIQTIDSFITDVFPIADGVVSGDVAIPEGIQEPAKANASVLIKFCRVAAYYEMMQRKTIFSNSLVLQGGILNADKVNEFNEAGGNNGMIATYIRKLYNDDRSLIPVIGISGDIILKAYTNIVDDVKRDIFDVKRKLAITTAGVRRTAFIEVAMNYLSTKVDQANRSTLVNCKMREYGLCIADCVKQYNINFKDAARNLIIKTEYSGTFVEMIQDKLGTAYLAMLSESECDKVCEDRILCADISVITDVVVEFIADKMLTVSKCTERVVPSGVKSGPVPTNNPPLSPEQTLAPGATPAQES